VSVSSVDDYVAAQPPLVRETLTAVREIIRAAVPDAQETIAYDMPTYVRGGKRFVHFAAWKNHWALYAMNERVRERFKDELRDCSIEGSTIRFAYGEPLPAELIARLVQFRAQGQSAK
jgi:uncharacterized protein YdhG (YjbR/CyaY superfamily)